MSRTIHLKAGGHVLLQTCDEQHVTLECDAASPPGSSLELVLAGTPVTVKVRACRRAETSNRYRVEGRWVNLSRAQRAALNI